MSNHSREEIKKEFNRNYQNREVVVIPPKEEYTHIEQKQELVAPYCRVSTLADEQVASFEMQRKYYMELIDSHPEWTLVGIYADEGISGTSMRRRHDFQKLIEDCKQHKITLVITKSVTRFARNLVDCISICRSLRNLNPPVGIYFETENINTLEQNSELQLSLFALLAQSESETKSLSVKWGIRRRFEKSIPRIVDLYGFVRHKLELTPDPDTAPIVQLIYRLLEVDRLNVTEIREYLHSLKIPSPTGKEWWSQSTLYYILSNEKYVGDVTCQKTFVADVFSHKVVKNQGQIKQYKWKNYHVGLIEREQWLNVQKMLFAREWSDFLITAESVVLNNQIFYPLKLGGKVDVQ